MGGAIDLKSTPGFGSTFQVELPFWYSKSVIPDDAYHLGASRISLVQLAQKPDQYQLSIERHLASEKANVTISTIENISATIIDNDAVLLLVNDIERHQQTLIDIYQAYQQSPNLLLVFVLRK